MRLVILHLSDMHCKQDTALKPASAVSACIREIPESIDILVVAVTGDLSFSGKTEELSVADAFLESLRAELRLITGVDPVLIVIPGNHDCSHPDDTILRDIVLKNIVDNDGSVNSPSLIEQAIAVQANFFDWLSGKGCNLKTPERIAWHRRIATCSREQILFLCINSAWMSTRNEVQGKIFVPPDSLPDADRESVVITLIHHPYNWLDANNGRAVRRHLEAVSDIILTGHEHDALSYSKTLDDTSIEYVEGGVFHTDTKPDASNFCIITVDTSTRQYRAQRYSWTRQGYRTTDTPSFHPYVRAAATIECEAIKKDEFASFLRDPGAQLTHRAKVLEFEDLFITPSLRRYISLGDGKGFLRKIVDSDHVLSTIFSEKTVYFAGDGQAGKTSFAKHIYHSALKRRIQPVWIKGEHLKKSDPVSIQKMISKAYAEQYERPSFESFLQLEPGRKAVIIDDLPDSKLNREGRAQAIDWIKKKYEYVFVFGGDFSHVEEMLVDIEEGGLVFNFSHYEIMELGYLLRNRLIEQWLTLGAEHIGDRETLAYRVGQIERLVDTVLGKNLLPAYPLFVLIMLQQIEAGTDVSTKSGAYGYFYEVLITEALKLTSQSLDDVDTKYTFLAEFAWYLRDNNTRECDREGVSRFSSLHWQEYRLTLNSERFLEEVIESRTLVEYGGRIGFRYKYLYYYFLARYIRDNMSDHPVTSAIDEYVRDLHREECANVIIFLTYLSKDKSIIQKLLSAAKSIYDDVPLCDLNIHIDFLNRLDNTIPQVILPASDPSLARRAELRRIDTYQQHTRSPKDTSGLADEDGAEELDLVLKLNRAFKAIQIMGQILRNFSGSLKGPIKRDLASECFAVGLRTLNAYYGLIEKNLEVMINFFSDFFGKKPESMEPAERVVMAKRIVFVLTELLCMGVIRRVSNAVGAEKLLPTYEDVQTTMDSLASEFIQVGIRMDHAHQFPEKRVLDLHKRVSGNTFTETLLKILVANHFYMFPRCYRVRQRICDKLGIVQTEGMLLATHERKRKQ